MKFIITLATIAAALTSVTASAHEYRYKSGYRHDGHYSHHRVHHARHPRRHYHRAVRMPIDANGNDVVRSRKTGAATRRRHALPG
jgi:hypothetical protein